MTKLVENNPQGTANIADDRVLATVLYYVSIFRLFNNIRKKIGYS